MLRNRIFFPVKGQKKWVRFRMSKANPHNEQILLQPIGFVKTDAIGDEVRDKSRLSRIIIREDLQEALVGIDDFSHLFVLFWLGEISPEDRMTLKVHPRGRKDLPLLGVFATRTNLRPNPVGLTLVELVKVEGNVLTVRGLDAFDATTILDIKPYDPWDSIAEPRVPKWWKKLQEEKLKRVAQKNNEE
jgi:tRNA-Thr(GGU) m(6)t(6)A37 methyltransferase TsaA